MPTRVNIFVDEIQILLIEEWLEKLPRDGCGRVKSQMKNFVWHSPGLRNDGWRAKCSIDFVDELDALEFKLRFDTRVNELR
jgi:hypothetical protein